MVRYKVLVSIAVFAASTVGASSPALPGVEQTAEEAINAKFATGLPEVLDRSGAASISVAHIESGRIVAMQAAGLSAPGQAATTQTRYNVASLTKPVSAEVILRLVAEGRFSLDQPMSSTWLDPDLAGDSRHERLTPRLALNHQTGFPNWRSTGGLRFESDPGGEAGYSGKGYEYVAKFIGHLTGAGIDHHAQRLVFKPLGMTATTYTAGSEAPAAVASSRSNDTWTPPVTRETPSAADDLVTNVGDYATFPISLMRRDALTPDLIAARARVQADQLNQMCDGIPASICPESAGPALGWTLFVIGGVPYYMHTGSDTDGFSLAYWSPSTGSGTVILTNSENGNRAVLPVLDLIGANPEFVALLREQASR